MRNWLEPPVEDGALFRGYAVPALLAAIALGLAVAGHLAATEAIDTTPIAVPAQPAPERPRPVSAASPQSIDRSAAELTETTSRPLFFADRRPPRDIAGETNEPARAEPALVPLKLVGIARIGAQSRILVRSDQEPGRWLSIGEEYQGWHFKEVLRESVLLEAGGQIAEIQLYPPRMPQ